MNCFPKVAEIARKRFFTSLLKVYQTHKTQQTQVTLFKVGGQDDQTDTADNSIIK